MKIVLLGYMGSGKSTIGKALAQYLQCDFMDLDTYIETEQGMAIAELFKAKGEIFFRREESRALKAVLAQNDSLVLALGGGTPCYGTNMDDILETATTSVYLDMSIPALVKRLSNEKAQRPLIAHLADEELGEFIGKHLFERRPFYRKAAHIVNCDDKSVAAIVNEIRNLL